MFTLPQLPYELSALEPFLTANTLSFHHGKHHAGYVKKLNASLEAYPELLAKTIEELLRSLSSLPTDVQKSVTNNGGQHYNHSLYWASMTPGGSAPSDALKAAIDRDFGSYEAFKEAFAKAGATQFGSGWAWLSVDASGKLVIEQTLNADTPLVHGKTPVLTMDVWEHAYYLDYQNLRPDYIEKFFSVIDWKAVSERYSKAIA